LHLIDIYMTSITKMHGTMNMKFRSTCLIGEFYLYAH